MPEWVQGIIVVLVVMFGIVVHFYEIVFRAGKNSGMAGVGTRAGV
jgi:hypothetical protein